MTLRNRSNIAIIRSFGAAFGLLMLTGCNTSAPPVSQSAGIEAPTVLEAPRVLSAEDAELLNYLYSIQDQFEQVARTAIPVSCYDIPPRFEARHDCFLVERMRSLGPVAPASIHDPLDVKLVLDSYQDLASIGLADYGVMPGNEAQLWVRIPKSAGDVSPIKRTPSGYAEGYPGFWLTIAEFGGAEVVPVMPASIFGYRPFTERTFMVRLSVLEHLTGVRSCYGELVPGTLRAFDPAMSDNGVRPRFGGVSLACSTTEL